jgi:hypothetical protein
MTYSSISQGYAGDDVSISVVVEWMVLSLEGKKPKYVEISKKCWPGVRLNHFDRTIIFI